MKRSSVLFVFIIPVISFIIGISTLSHYGINWDEPFHYRRGQAFLQYLITGQKTYANMPKYPPLKGDSDNPNFGDGEKNFLAVQKDPSLSKPDFRRSFYQDDSWDGRYFIDELDTYGHPPLNDVLAALFNKIFFQDLGIVGDLESYRLFIVSSVFLAACLIAYFMWKEFGLSASIISTLAFTTYPLVLGEQHFNIKDPVEASFYTITLLSAYWGIKNNKFKWLLIAVFSFAIATGTKFNMLFGIVPLGIWFLYYIFTNWKKIKKPKLIRNLAIAFLITPFVCLGILFISYPTLWHNPIKGFSGIVSFYKEVGYPSSQPQNLYSVGPINVYPTLWILYSTPPVIIGLFLISVLFIKKLIKNNDFVLLLFLWLFVAIGRNSLFGALSYGGVRIIMEYVPALCMLAGIAAGFIVSKFRNKKYRIAAFSILILCFVPTFIKLIKIHPNENVYFNFLIGGLSGAKAINFPYWGDSYGNAYFPGIEWINRNAPLNSKVSTPIGNTSNIPRFKLRNDIAVSPYYWSGLKHNGEYLIEMTFDYNPENYFALRYLNEAMVPVYEVKVDNVAIAKVWENDPSHIRAEYSQTKSMKAKITSDKKNKTLQIDIPEVEKIMAVNITQPTKECSSLVTGYVITSSDGKSWSRETEDIAIDQLDREAIKQLTGDYVYYFMAKPAKTLVFNTDSSNNCLLKAKSATVTFLKP